jgi:hypothetical protein
MNLNTCKGMMGFLKFSGQILKKTIITLQVLRFMLKCLNQTCLSLKSIMQLTMTISPYSASFIEKKRVENRLWRKSEFLWQKKNISLEDSGSTHPPGRLESGSCHMDWVCTQPEEFE